MSVSAPVMADPFRQIPANVAVIIPTTLAATLPQAVQSVFDQDFPGRIQILIGIDVAKGSREALNALIAACPANVTIDVLDLGYSTAARHGGVHTCGYGGSLRSALSFLANSRYVAYLDDDNWWAPDHLSSLLTAIEGHAWAYSARWMVDPRNSRPVCIDTWESVGPDAGVFAKNFGGFVDTSSLMIDKLVCASVLPLWSHSVLTYGDGEDRLVFAALRKSFPGAPSGAATSFYRITETDIQQPQRLPYFTRAGYDWDTGTGGAYQPPVIGAALSAAEKCQYGVLAIARRQAADGQLLAAIGVLASLLAVFPNNREALRLLGTINLNLNNHADAAMIFDYLGEPPAFTA